MTGSIPPRNFVFDSMSDVVTDLMSIACRRMGRAAMSKPDHATMTGPYAEMLEVQASNSIAGGLLALIEHPDQMEFLRGQPELIDQAPDELIR